MTYLGFDVLELKPDRPGAIPEGTARAHESLDTQTGQRWTDLFEPAPVGDIVFHWPCVGRAAALANRQWMDTRKGVVVPFWAPTWMPDLTLAANANAGASQITILPVEYSTLVWPYGRRHLAVYARGAAPSYHYVSDADDGTVETLTITPVLPVAWPAETTTISFLRFMRVAEPGKVDRVWHGGHFCQATVNFVEIPQEAPTP